MPQCINVNATQGTHTQMKSCDFEDVHNVKLLFRTPDPRQQNGNVLFYIVWFKSEGNDKLFQQHFTDSDARDELIKYKETIC